MKEIRVALGRRSYKIFIGARLEDLGRRLKGQGFSGRAHIITHPVLKALYGNRLASGLKRSGFDVTFALFPSGEQHKNIATAEFLYASCAAAHLRRGSTLIALGGGVVGDVAGFVAATYLRGINFVNVPTTLLAMVDSSIGGKTGVDLPEGKNLVGAFYQPALVWCDLSTLKTLPSKEWKTGMAEIVKYGVIQNGEFFRFLERHFHGSVRYPVPARDLEHMVERSAAMKAAVVSRDEFENRGLRQILNFGHTTAHALEASTSYRDLTHGEAVSIGMCAAGRIAAGLGIFREKELARVENLLRAAELPTHAWPSAFNKRFWEAMARDKKIEKDELRFVLPVKIGRVVVRDVSKATVAKALEEPA